MVYFCKYMKYNIIKNVKKITKFAGVNFMEISEAKQKGVRMLPGNGKAPADYGHYINYRE